MKIARTIADRVELSPVAGTSQWSGGMPISRCHSTIAGVETECRLIGQGEVCPLGPFAFPAGLP